uniref:Malate dehydrogenase, cytoplasmic n=1 Tax=Otolemur garnettii TaxID=30611 RepID=H0XJW4_OTOGA
KDQPIILAPLGITLVMGFLDGILLELQHCSLSLLKDIATGKKEVSFKDLDTVIPMGTMPRREATEKKDLQKANVKILKHQGAALEKYAKKVGKPANPNCPAPTKAAPPDPKKNFSSLTSLDHNQAEARIALKLGVTANDVKDVIFWGNYSSNQRPDVNLAKVKPQEYLKDDSWLRGESISTCSHTAGSATRAPPLPSDMSAAETTSDHVSDIQLGCPKEGLGPGILSGSAYRILHDPLCSVPVAAKSETRKVARSPVNEFSREKVGLTAKEPAEGKKLVLNFFPVL